MTLIILHFKETYKFSNYFHLAKKSMKRTIETSFPLNDVTYSPFKSKLTYLPATCDSRVNDRLSLNIK